MSSKKLPEQPRLIKVQHFSHIGVLAFLLNAGGSHNFSSANLLLYYLLISVQLRWECTVCIRAVTVHCMTTERAAQVVSMLTALSQST
jgi:hypothetical protein